MSVISSSATVSQFDSMLDLLSNPERTKAEHARLQKMKEEALSAQRKAEEANTAISTKTLALDQREASVAKREAEVESTQKSLAQRASENEKKYQSSQAELEQARYNVAQQEAQNKSKFEAVSSDLSKREADLLSSLAMIDTRSKDLQSREQAVLDQEKANCQLREKLNARLVEFQKLRQI